MGSDPGARHTVLPCISRQAHVCRRILPCHGPGPFGPTHEGLLILLSESMSMDPSSYVAGGGVDLTLFRVGGAGFGGKVGASASGKPGKEVGLDWELGPAPMTFHRPPGETLA